MAPESCREPATRRPGPPGRERPRRRPAPATARNRVAFDRIEALGYRTEETAADGVAEICEALEAGTVDKTVRTITLDWRRELTRWRRIIREVEMYGGIVEI